ncbi:MAG: hypothetical protein RBU37_23780 [Myxococcota bacterium]|jgi:hypothetical protein|nr:hypothetical protein [Myxococcota bacterium]
MPDKTVFIYSSAATFQIDQVGNWFSLSGLQIEQSSGEVILWTEQGERVVADAADWRARFENDGDVSFQYWLDGSHDLYCRYRRIGTVMEESYGLDGLRREELDRAILALATRVVGLGVVRRLDFAVFDIDGACEDSDWASLAVRRLVCTQVWPTVFIGESSTLNLLGEIPSTHFDASWGPLTIVASCEAKATYIKERSRA